MTKLYVTTAIPYVNGTPHIGHALDYLLADVWARYQKTNGNEVRYQVGTDEHGNKIAAKAASLNVTPKEYTDKMYVNFENLMKKVGASYTDFIRTTDATHQSAVQHIWQQLEPYIYKGSYDGWYCIGCEAFVSDKEADSNNGVCGDHNQPYQRLSEDNYYLKTSAFTDRIRTAIETDVMKIEPEFRKKEFLELIKDGLQDVSISRPRKNLSWGVPVPGDDSQVMYVWLDALANYITVLGYPDKEGWQEYWPADLQVIGKDILRFHAGIWPAMLLGLGLELPKRLLVHGFVNVGGVKQSKSLGNGVDPNDVIDQYGVEAFRYFFSRHVPTLDDSDFTWEKFETAYNSELGNDLGNLIQRIASMVVRYQGGIVEKLTDIEGDVARYHESMESLNFNYAMDEAWLKVRNLNQYLENTKPWEIAKNSESDPKAAEHLGEVLAHAVSGMLQIGDLLAPFLPATATSIGEIFKSGTIQLPDGVLFPKIYRHTPDPHAKSA